MEIKYQVLIDRNRFLVIVPMMLFLFVISHVSGQNRTIDSLKALLPGTNDRQKSDLYLELAFETMDMSPREALAYSRKLYTIASGLKDSLRMIKGIRLEALAYRKLENMDSSNIVSLKGIVLAKNFPMQRDVTMLFNGLALGYMWTADYDRSLLFNLKTYASAFEIQDSALIIASLNNMGLLYYKLNDRQKAIELYKQALRYEPKGEPTSTIVKCYLNLALCYTRESDLKNAQKYLRMARPFISGAPSILSVDFYFNKGLYYEHNSQLDSALVNQSLALEQAISINSTLRQNISCIELADLYLTSNDVRSSVKYLKMAESLIVPSSYKSEMLTTYNLLATLNHRIGNLKMAWHYQQKYIELNDSIYNSKFVNNLIEIEKNFLEGKKNEEIRKEKEVVAQKDATIRYKTTIVVLSSMTAFFLFFIALVFFKAYKQKRYLNDLLDKKVQERTIELKISEGKLKRICDEQVETLQKLKADVGNNYGVIEGLCAAALRDEQLCELAKEYVRRILGRVK